jgi:hypothetical protein
LLKRKGEIGSRYMRCGVVELKCDQGSHPQRLHGGISLFSISLVKFLAV